MYQLYIYNLLTVNSAHAVLYVFELITCFIYDDLELAECVYLIRPGIRALEFSQLILMTDR